MKDEKYVVFKREEWVAFERAADGVINWEKLQESQAFPHIVDDAVVVRKQDIFAGPALHAYSSSISTALEILDAEQVVLGGGVVHRLNEIRDYFFQQALEAD